MNVFEKDKNYIMNSYARYPVSFVRGRGSLLYDQNDKEYIDLASGIGGNIFGVNDEEWKNAVLNQMKKIQHTSNLYYSEPCTELAQMLVLKTGMSKVFFSNSGAEANECAIKAARRYSFKKYGGNRHTIITLKNSFHGRTLTTLTATGQEDFHVDFAPFTDGFVYADPTDINDIKRLTGEQDCAAIMIEIVQGEGGVYSLAADYINELVKIAEEKDILLIIDEVQTGNGRTGKLYSYMNYDLKPDIVTTAKGLGGGLPIGATLFSEKLYDVLPPGTHGSTFGGNPLASAGAVNILSRIDNTLLSDVTAKADYIKKEMSTAHGVLEISGMGLMIGIKTEKNAKEVAKECLEKGVVVLTAKDKVRLLPPLNIPFGALEKAINTIKEIVKP